MTYTELTGLNSANVTINPQRLSEWLRVAYDGDRAELMKVLSKDPERTSDKKAVMKRSHLDSTINRTTGQGLGSALDNLIFYVDACVWWRHRFNAVKYYKSLSRDKKRTRRKPVPRIANR